MHYRLFLSFALLFWTGSAGAQDQTSRFDTLAIRKPWAGRLVYETDLPQLSKVTLKIKDPKRSAATTGRVAGDAARNLLSGLTGINVSSSHDMRFLIQGILQTNREEDEWRLHLYCPGELEKTSSRTRNADGSKSVQVSKTTQLFWGAGANGYLHSGNDTAGRFRLYMAPLADSMLHAHFKELFAGAAQTFGHQPVTTLPDRLHFAAVGTLRQKPLVVLFESSERVAWIFVDKQLAGVLRSDTDEYEGLFGGNTRNRVSPFLLYRSELPELADCLRLAMLSRLLYRTVSQDLWGDVPQQ